MNDREFCEHLDIEVKVLRIWVEQRWLMPQEADAGWLFEDADLARAADPGSDGPHGGQ